MVINFKHTRLSWYFIRISVLLVIPVFLFDSEILFLVQSLLLVHIKSGLESITSDYVHNYTTRILYLSLIRVVTLESFFSLIELIL